MGCDVDYEPHLGSVELEDHEMFKLGDRVPPEDTAIVWGWAVVEDRDWTGRCRILRIDVTVKTKGRRAEDRALKGATQLQQQERTWGQLGEHSHLRNHPHRELRGKCSKKEAVGCDTGY